MAIVIFFMRWRTHALRRQNQWLEQRVMLRTAELEIANRKLGDAAGRDALTGLYNRRGFREAIAPAWGVAKEECVLMIADIDHFKLFNDTHGHHVGDEVLAEVGARLTAGMMDGDLLARWGGEEFIVFLRGQLPIERAKTLRDSIGKSAMSLSCGKIVVTMTAGAIIVGDASLDATLQRADEGLYEGKRHGRDKLIIVA